MVTIDDLKESLREQLATLIALYEAESSSPATGLREPGAEPTGHEASLRGACVAIPAGPTSLVADADADADADDAGTARRQPAAEMDAGSVERALAIESCLQDFSAAIIAAEAAATAAAAAHGQASGMLQRASDSRAVAMMMRRDAEKRLRDLALGRVVPTFEAHRLAEAQAAARISAGLSRQSEAEASALCLRAREAAQCAAIALAAACRADPRRVNARYDPTVAQAARADAQAAADRAGQLAAPRRDPLSAPALPAPGPSPRPGREV